jgi:hypothetical protein
MMDSRVSSERVLKSLTGCSIGIPVAGSFLICDKSYVFGVMEGRGMYGAGISGNKKPINLEPKRRG